MMSPRPMKIAGTPIGTRREPDRDHGVVREHVRKKPDRQRQDAREVEQELEGQKIGIKQPEVDLAADDLPLEEARPHELDEVAARRACGCRSPV